MNWLTEYQSYKKPWRLCWICIYCCWMYNTETIGFVVVAQLFCCCCCAKLLQSCPTLCDPTDGGPPDSPIPGILQARTLEWVAISFSNAWKWKVKVKTFSSVVSDSSDPMDCNLLGSSAHGIFQARVLVWGVSCSIVSSSLRPHGLQHTKLPCPSPSPGACSNSCTLSWWGHPTISSFVVPFSCCLQSFPASGSFLMSWPFASGGQSIGVSESILPMNIHDWFLLDWLV